MNSREFNFDGIVGPTHNYSGLSFGNEASTAHQNQTSSPRLAARQGLDKMKLLFDLGIPQAVLPPLLRPRLQLLRDVGFSGTDTQLIESAFKTSPTLLAACYSSSNMWTANASTVSPSRDTGDGRVHLTPANLTSTLHRSIEPDSTYEVLRFLFADENHFMVHQPLPSTASLADEGAANHTRIAINHLERGIEIFTYGTAALDKSSPRPSKYPARQTLEACQAIARRHRLNPDMVFAIQQTPQAIDAGVFHNDVISVGNENVLLCHESAFVDQDNQLKRLAEQFESKCGGELLVIQFSKKEISLSETVNSYLFNSQLVTKPNGKMMLISPSDCQRIEAAKRCIERLVSEPNPVEEAHFMDLRQSMNNGGGPACLRLRVVLSEHEQAAVHPGVLFSNDLYASLCKWIDQHYRETLEPDDLRDPQLIVEASNAILELSNILGIPPEILMGKPDA